MFNRSINRNVCTYGIEHIFGIFSYCYNRFFGNAILAILLTILGQKLNVDIYLAAIIVFVGRMFTNLAIIRRYYIDIVMKKIEDKKSKKANLKEEKTE